jgi:organic radical activating enzyme
MKINPNTFCGATWFQVRNRQDMTKTVCCLVDYLTEDPGTEELTPIEYLNTPKMVTMREQMAKGIKVPQCQECWKHEQHGDQSYRQQINKFLEGPWLDAYFKHKEDYNTDLVVMSDIKVGNTCNFACVMCNPQDSSMIYNHWVKNKQSPFVQDYLKQDNLYLDKAKASGYKQSKYREYVDSAVLSNKHIKLIKLLGGEPLLDEKLMQQLNDIPAERKNKIQLQVVTNGSLSLVKRSKQLEDFMRVKYCVSLEGIGEAQDYARLGSNWKTLEPNLLEQLAYNKASLTIMTCLQATTFTRLPELLKWTKKHKIPFAISGLEHPNYLTINAVPDQLKQEVLAKINTVGNYYVDNEAENIALDIKSLIDFIADSKYNKDMHKKFVDYLKFYEKGRSMKKFIDVFPEWEPYLEV